MGLLISGYAFTASDKSSDHSSVSESQRRMCSKALALAAEFGGTSQRDSGFLKLPRQVAHYILDCDVQRGGYLLFSDGSFGDVIEHAKFVAQQLRDLEAALSVPRYPRSCANFTSC